MSRRNRELKVAVLANSPSKAHPLILVVDAAAEERVAWCVRLCELDCALVEADTALLALALVTKSSPDLAIIGRFNTLDERLTLARQITGLPGAPPCLVEVWSGETLPAPEPDDRFDLLRLPDDDTFLLQRVRRSLAVSQQLRSSAPAPPTPASANIPSASSVHPSSFAVVTVDAEGVVMTWNPTAELVLGWSAAEMVGSVVSEHVGLKETLSALCALSRNAVGSEFELRLQRKDGAWIDLLVAVTPLNLADDDAPTRFLVIAQDVTERRQTEAAERENLALAETLQDISKVLSSTLDPHKLMDLILDHIGRVVPHDAASIMRISGGFARVTHTRGYPPDVAEVITREDFSLDQSNMGVMMQTGEPVVVTDVLRDPNWMPMSGLRWIRSYCGMPLKVRGEIIGFLNLDSHTPGTFTQAHAERLRTLATQVSMAIENAHLYDSLRRDAVELNVLQRATSALFSKQLMTQSSLEAVGLQVARTVVQEFGQVDCGVILLDDTRTRFMRLARAGRYEAQPNEPLYLNGKGLVPAAARLGEPIYAPDVRLDERYLAAVPSTRSELALPLRTTQGVIGVLDLQSTHVDAFSETDRRILMSFADQVAAAIENILLYNRVRRYSADLEVRVNERTAELHRVKERVEAILNNSSDAIVMARADGTIQQTNQAFNLLFQYEVDAAFGQPLTVLVRRDYAGQIESGIQQAVVQKEAVRLELVAVTSYGAQFDADMMVSPIRERDDAVLGIVCSIRDYTARKRTEEELRRALLRERELNELKSRFISTASHEFRTPLALIMTSTDMLLTYGARLDENQKQHRLENIQAEVRNITVLLDDLLTVSRAAQTGSTEFQPAQIDLVALCEAVVQEARAGVGTDHSFEMTVTGEERFAWVDRKLLKRALANLLSNAVKYSPAGSVVRLELMCNADAWIIRIQDEGIGIPEADQPDLFQAFHRGSNAGTIPGLGLGLAIVKHAVSLHSGTIDVQSRVDAGTTFTLTLPVIVPKEDADEKNSGH
jgi:PAS domain S-box-containing protein